jgi:nucleoid-associated protein YgaU
MSVDMETLEDALTEDSSSISGTVEGSGDSFTFVTDQPIKSARKYTITVSGVQDEAGNSMAGDYTFSFSVSTPKRIHWYIVQEGDTIPSIATRPDTYDNIARWKWIVEANQDERLSSRDRIITGQRILIPWGPAWEGE